MTSEEYVDILYNHRILRWSARILGTIEVVLLGKKAWVAESLLPVTSCYLSDGLISM
jgi:hypothetical protein